MDSSQISYLMNTLCRICAEKSSRLVPIFEVKMLPVKIYKCLPIKVSAGDDLPTKICEMCLLKIDESYLFHETCLFAEQKLKKILKSLVQQSTATETDLVVNQSPGSEDDGCSRDNYSNEYSIIANKLPVGMLVVSKAEAFEESVDNQEFGNKVENACDLIINITDVSNFNTISAADIFKDQMDNFAVNNELVSSKCGVQEESYNLKSATDKSTNNPQMEIIHDNPACTGNILAEEQENQNMKSYKCQFCSEQFSTLASLTSHESTHFHEKPFLCDTCGKSFKHANNLKSHIKIHSKHRKKFMCKICSKTFFTNFFLQEHMNTHTGETPYKCQICGKEFREKVHLRQHKWTHSTEKFLCPVCGNHFNRKGNMMEHIKKYHSSNEKEKANTIEKETKKSVEAKFQCPLCKKSFTSQIVLKNHHKRHMNKHSHFCSLCGKQFRHSGSLTYHRRTAHTGEKPFGCSYCDEKFSLRSVQRIHERKQHTFENPYKCSFCSRVFNNSSSLKNHSYVHMKEKMFECDVCGKKFSRNSNLFVHKKIHLDDRQYTCEQCGKSYIQKHDMIKHKKVHDPKSKPYFCKYCANSFAHKKDFARHASCHFDYIRKTNSQIGNAEKILETVTGELQKSPPSDLFVDDLLILESSEQLLEENLQKMDVT